MLENDEHKEKQNFTESEIEVLLAEVEVRAGTLFESLSSSSSSTLLSLCTQRNSSCDNPEVHNK